MLRDQLVQSYLVALERQNARGTEGYELFDEAMNFRMPRNGGPVEPRGFIVEAVRVVVATLRAADLIAHEQHGGAGREQRQREKVLDLTVAQLLGTVVLRRSLDTAVPAVINVVPVAIRLAVRLVVLVVVGNEVVQREAIVARDEVDALFRFAILRAIDVGAAENAGRKRSDGPLITLEEAAHVVAKPAVPLLPGIADEAADLVKAGRVPCFRDQLDVGEHRIGFDVEQHGRGCDRAPSLIP